MKTKTPPKSLVCEECGDEFWARSDAKTCSPKCKKRRQRKLWREKKDSEV